MLGAEQPCEKAHVFLVAAAPNFSRASVLVSIHS
jgi:hypothetical protein